MMRAQTMASEYSVRDGVIETYLTKFPALKKLHQASEILSFFWESSFYRISPEWIRLIDNSKGFGHKDEMIFRQRKAAL